MHSNSATKPQWDVQYFKKCQSVHANEVILVWLWMNIKLSPNDIGSVRNSVSIELRHVTYPEIYIIAEANYHGLMRSPGSDIQFLF